uniref:protein-serine/threonine phosphatase n=1 Tax=Tanacetum cinerariifolium TaxID=118510 RepID=A0A6L2M0K5_TANCI|nr:probable protein phosphatase 2C 49 [Tanacetum cinerariifolium]
MLQDVKSYLGRCFAMNDLGEAAYIFGIKIYRDRPQQLIGLCQSAYIEKILKRYYMENFKRGMGFIMYDVRCTRPEALFLFPTTNAAVTCLASTKSTLLEGSRLSSNILSGSHTDIGASRSNEDQHIHIDDVSKHLGDDVYKWAHLPSSFYAVFDGHGGSKAASYVKDHVMRLSFENSDLREANTSVDELFLKELQDCN